MPHHRKTRPNKESLDKPHQRNIHSHTWLVGLLGLAAGLVLLIYVPSLKVVSGSILLFAGFHLIGALVVLVSLYSLALRRLFQKVSKPRNARPQNAGERYDFGWGPEWMNGLGVAALVAFSVGVAIQVAIPHWWPLAFLSVTLGTVFVVGNSIMRSFRSHDHVVLPMVKLLAGDRDVVLDAGCGSGRTTIALSRILGGGHIVAVDRFDADYIDDGGRGLFERNIRIAGLTDKVRVETADLTALPFDSASFDSAVSTHVYDHLGDNKEKALREIYRVLKPGGRFLMAVWVPGGTMFAVANVLSFFLTPRRRWRMLAQRAGLEIVDEGVFNYAWFVVMRKPADAATAEPESRAGDRP